MERGIQQIPATNFISYYGRVVYWICPTQTEDARCRAAHTYFVVTRRSQNNKTTPTSPIDEY